MCMQQGMSSPWLGLAVHFAQFKVKLVEGSSEKVNKIKIYRKNEGNCDTV